MRLCGGWSEYKGITRIEGRESRTPLIGVNLIAKLQCSLKHTETGTMILTRSSR